MRRREARRKRAREQLPAALQALIALVPADRNVQQYLTEAFGTTQAADTEGDAVIEGAGLQRLLDALGTEACPEGVHDLLRIARRVPRSVSTPARLHIAELCFAVSQATLPANTHERRKRAAEGQLSSVAELLSTPLLQYYRGRRFRALLRGEDGSSSPATRHAAEATAAGDAHEDADAQEEEREWERFVACMATPLPMTLRVHQSEPVYRRLALSLLTRAVHEEGGAARLQPVACLPAAMAAFTCSHATYHENMPVQRLCRSLHTASAVSFQEVVSMLPGLVLDARPEHRVLDMCAAPGSKTLQALDAQLQHGWQAAAGHGVLIANEKDRVKATQTLPSRLKRYHAPNVLCTRCDATQWPRLYALPPDEHNTTSGNFSGCPAAPREWRVDRVVCDVPCSGDGTLRKEPAAAMTWAASYVQSLVPTQRALLCRGLEALRADGGVLVYSTCSLNPKEDEEVVCAALERFGDCVEMVDVNAVLRAKGVALHSCGGLRRPSVEALQERVVPASYHGERVLRVLPHRDDTGGFFVAALRKVREPDWTAPRVTRERLNQWMRGRLWAAVGAEDTAWQSIVHFYGLDATRFHYFYHHHHTEDDGVSSQTDAQQTNTRDNHTDTPSHHHTPNVTSDDEEEDGLVPIYQLNPHGAPARRIMFVTQAAARLLFAVRPFKGPGVEVVTAGVRGFEAYVDRYLPQALCRWRAVMESASYLAARCRARRRLLLHVRTHRAAVEQLLRTGSLTLPTHWPLLLMQATGASSSTSSTDGASTDEASVACHDGSIVRTDSELAAYLRSLPHTETHGGAEGTTAAVTERVMQLVEQDLIVGGVLLGIVPEGEEAHEEQPWYVSATLTTYKLELAIDASLRDFGLRALLGIAVDEQHESEDV